MARRKAKLRKRFNKDGSVSVLLRGRVICKTRDLEGAETFIAAFTAHRGEAA